jgi:hypothetical protein
MDMSGSPKVPKPAPAAKRWLDRDEVLRRVAKKQPVAQIAREMEFTKNAIYNVINGKRKAKDAPPAPESDKVDVERAKAMARDGVMVKAIAAHFEVSLKVLNYVARRHDISWRALRGEGTKPARTAKVAAGGKTAAQVAVQAAAVVSVHHGLPMGYISDLIDTGGKYLALDAWRAKYGTADRPISPAKALQEWHKYRGAM